MLFQTLEELRTYLGYESFPVAMQPLFDDYRTVVNHHFMHTDELKETLVQLKLDLEQFSDLIKMAEHIGQDAMLSEALRFLTYVMVIGAHPSFWLIKQGPSMKHALIPDSAMALLIILSLVRPSLDEYEKRDIDRSHAEFNLRHLHNYVNQYIEKHHTYGIEPFGWTSYLASLGLIHLKSLNFMHHVYTDAFTGWIHKRSGELVMMVNKSVQINRFGQFTGVNDINDVCFITAYHETEQEIFGHPVHPQGIVVDRAVTLDKHDWVCVLKPGDPVIDFHIPTGVPYDIPSIRETLETGREFFRKHYPEHPYQAFWCVSWLYSPQLPHIIRKPQSNILAIQRQGYVCPATPGASSLYSFVFKKNDPDFSQLTPKTSLESDVIDFVKKGGAVNAGLWIYLLDDLGKFGLAPYQRQADTHAFENIRPFKEDFS